MGFSRQEYWSGLPLPSPFYKLALPIFTVSFEMDYNPLYSDEEEVSERLNSLKLGFIALPDIWLTSRKR